MHTVPVNDILNKKGKRQLRPLYHAWKMTRAVYNRLPPYDKSKKDKLENDKLASVSGGAVRFKFDREPQDGFNAIRQPKHDAACTRLPLSKRPDVVCLPVHKCGEQGESSVSEETVGGYFDGKAKAEESGHDMKESYHQKSEEEMYKESEKCDWTDRKNLHGGARFPG